MKEKSFLPKKWDKEADVVVVGYGDAGAATAITAHDLGAKVVILEKAPQGEEGGNSRVAGQGWISPTPADQAIEYFNSLCAEYTVPQDMVKVWAEEMGKNTDWVKSLGGKPVERVVPSPKERAEFPDLPGAECMHTYSIDRATAGFGALWKLLKASVDKRGIEVLYATPAKELIQNCPEKEILGVRAEREGKLLNIKARKAVVLTCGGFEGNQEMVRDYIPNLPYCYPLGTPYNTGDGIKMAMAVGADLWHMSSIAGPCYCSMKVPEFPSVMEIPALEPQATKVFPGGVILVGKDGKRFVDEKQKVTHGKVKVHGQWVQSPTPCPLFMIFDQDIFETGLYRKDRYHGWNPLLNVYDWSKDNSAELAKGWIKKADTVAELAKKIGLDPAAVEDSVNKWNAYCADGKDLEFGRTRMLSPIKGPPFYAIEISPHFVNTQGGPRRNEKSQILQVNREPIPRLYAAGELGSIYSFLYNGCGNLGECMAFGRICGRNAVAEKPWG